MAFLGLGLCIALAFVLFYSILQTDSYMKKEAFIMYKIFSWHQTVDLNMVTVSCGLFIKTPSASDGIGRNGGFNLASSNFGVGFPASHVSNETHQQFWGGVAVRCIGRTTG